MRLHAVDAEQESIYKDEYRERFQRLDGVFEKDKEEQEADKYDCWRADIQIFSEITRGEIVGSDEVSLENLVLVEGDVRDQRSESSVGQNEGSL